MNINMLNNKLPDLTFEPGRIALNLQTQNFQVEEFNLKGNHLELDLSGRLNMSDSLRRSRIFLTLRFKPSDELEEALGMLMYAMKEPDADGFYKMTISGTPGNISTSN